MDIDIKDNLEDKDMWFKILYQWILNNNKYAEELNYKDVIYWHNEMANNSCLVSAIWQLGGVATSEYSVIKEGTIDGGKADIFFKLNNTTYLIESKFTRTNNEIEQYMEDAKIDCRKSDKEKGINKKMAIVFLSQKGKKEDINYQAYDIKAKFGISAKKEVRYRNEVYNSVYLFGKYV